MILFEYLEHFDYLLNEAGALNFSTFNNKLKNRTSEFDAIAKVLTRKKYYNVLSFPAEYSFERSFYDRFKIPLNVYVMQSKFNIKYAKRFMRDTGGTNSVMVPVKSVQHQYRPKTSIRSDDVIDGGMKYSPVDFTRAGVMQGYETLPSRFDLIDLDYMGIFTPHLLGQVGGMYHDKLDNGGLLFVTFNLTGYRSYDASAKRTASDLNIDRKDDIFKQFDMDVLKSSRKKPLDKKDVENYGISKNLDVYKNMAGNMIDIINRAISKKPVYINLYRGGTSSKGNIMLRLIYKK